MNLIIKFNKSLRSHIQTLLSLEQDAKYDPSDDHDVHLTSFSWPSKFAISSKSLLLFRFQTIIDVSKLAVAYSFYFYYFLKYIY